MTYSISNGTTALLPLVVINYSSSNASQNIVHNVLGRSYPDIDLVAAAPRTGRIEAVFQTEADAEACRVLHLAASTFMFAASDAPTTNMTYVVDGAIAKTVDTETSFWIVSIDYREVGP